MFQYRGNRYQIEFTPSNGDQFGVKVIDESNEIAYQGNVPTETFLTWGLNTNYIQHSGVGCRAIFGGSVVQASMYNTYDQNKVAALRALRALHNTDILERNVAFERFKV